MGPMTRHVSANVLRRPLALENSARLLGLRNPKLVQYIPSLAGHPCVLNDAQKGTEEEDGVISSSNQGAFLSSLAATPAVLLWFISSSSAATTASVCSVPTFALFAGQHAREVANPEIAVRVAEELVATDKRTRRQHAATSASKQFAVLVMWHAAVRGSEFVWQKDRNRRTTVPGGVDPNRNYPTSNWTNFPSSGASPHPSDWTYRGPWPASEPETRLVMRLLAGFNVVTLLNLHSGGRSILRGADQFDAIWRMASALQARFLTEANRKGTRWDTAARLREYRQGASCCAGTVTRYAAEVHNVTAVTLETFSHSEFWPGLHSLEVELDGVVRTVAGFILEHGARKWW